MKYEELYNLFMTMDKDELVGCLLSCEDEWEENLYYLTGYHDIAQMEEE